jgi:diacylglycerol kinase (ATP)
MFRRINRFTDQIPLTWEPRVDAAENLPYNASSLPNIILCQRNSEAMPKICIIANPAAGGGTARKKIPQIQRLIAESGLDAELLVTERRGHGIELARQAATSGSPVVVSAGGDGTLNEVINGLMLARSATAAATAVQNPALGVLCIGRGNDFAGSVGLPADLESGFQVLTHGKRRPVDIGRVYGGLFPEGRYFGNCVGVGFDAMTTIQVSRMPRMGGFLSFLIAVLKTIFLYYKGPKVTIEYDDQTLTLPTLLVSVMNGRRLGGGFWLAPTALPDDGLFDLCIAHEMGRIEIFLMIPHFLKGTQGSQPAIKTGQAKHIVITAQTGSLPAQTDGEILCVDGQRLEVELLPRELEVIFP